jgi:hypothetical protein
VGRGRTRAAARCPPVARRQREPRRPGPGHWSLGTGSHWAWAYWPTGPGPGPGCWVLGAGLGPGRVSARPSAWGIKSENTARRIGREQNPKTPKIPALNGGGFFFLTDSEGRLCFFAFISCLEWPLDRSPSASSRCTARAASTPPCPSAIGHFMHWHESPVAPG